MISLKSSFILALAGVIVSFAMFSDISKAQNQKDQTQQNKDNINSSSGWQTQSLPENSQNSPAKKKTNPVKKTDLPVAGKEKSKSAEQKNVRKRPAKKVSTEYKKTNSNSIRIISSTIDSSGLLMANDLARILDDPKKIRVVPIIGKGAARSLKDIYYMKGVDIGIIQQDVLEHYKKNKKLPDPKRFIRYITTLGTQEVHLIARRQIKSLVQLDGKTVNIGPSDDGNAIAAKAVFDAYGLQVNSVHLDNRAAIRRLKNGEIDAVVLVGGKPVSNLLSDLAASKDFHLVDIGFNPQLGSMYKPTVMIHEDYPYLIDEHRVVSSISVDVVMAMYFWPKGTARYNKVKRFVDAFFEKLPTLRSQHYHGKWKEVQLENDLKGWKRFLPAQEWLKSKKQNKKVSARLPAR